MKIFIRVFAVMAVLGISDKTDAAIVRTPLAPTKIVWLSDTTDTYIRNPEILLNEFSGQISVADNNCTVLRSDNSHQSGMLLDFGKELHGAIKISAGLRSSKQPIRLRVRFGESVSEAMSEVAPDANIHNATNEHAMRDFELQIPWLGSVEYGNSGFRFVRIDLLDRDTECLIKGIQAISVAIDDPEIGYFNCSDDRINQIWKTGAYTVKLNMQDFIWDGIKRDRLVWLGDLHPEVLTVSNVWGNHEVVKRTLDFGKADTPLPGWMNGFSSYSMWWLIIHRDYYLHNGDIDYLLDNRDYILGLTRQIGECIDSDGCENMTGVRFLDWPTSEQNEVIHNGLQALAIMTLNASIEIGTWLNDSELIKVAEEAVSKMRNYNGNNNNATQVASLRLLSGTSADSESDCQTIINNGLDSFSPFYGFYAIEALASHGHLDAALEMMSEYWGSMLDLGATTFWEHFNYSEKLSAGRIDEFVPEGKYDIHADGGAFCYVGLRQSLCHGWAAGPTPWLQRYVLGVKPLEPGCRRVEVKPNLGYLSFAEGSVPTPKGPVYVKAFKDSSGHVKCSVKAPKGIKIKKIV